MRMIFACGLLALLSCPGARAQTLVASRPGLMCGSADALAALTLPDGSDRAAGPQARPGDKALERQGGCIAIPNGARVEVQAARRNTSIVTYDAGDGRGPRTFIVPNRDFVSAPGSVPATAGPTSCIRYGVEVTLPGRITIGSAYGEDTHGKVGWSHWHQITLDRPICTLGDRASSQEPERNVAAIQPAWTEEDSSRAPPGRHVVVTGKLFHADNANQMTLVLIAVDRIVAGP